MAELQSTQVTGKVSATLPASDPTDYVRLAEFQQALSGVAPQSHTHLARGITDLANPATMLPLLREVLVDTETAALAVEADGLGFSVRLAPGGGLKPQAEGLAVDPAVVSLVGHQHALGDVAGLASGVKTQVATLLQGSGSVGWTATSSQLIPAVRLKTNGALLCDAGGVYVALGSGPQQAAAGDHTHDQLHNALTLAASSTLELTLAGQQLSAEVLVAEAGGLLVRSGLAVDLGSGPAQAAPGNHTHAGLDGLANLQATLTALLANGNLNLAAGQGLVINGVQVVGTRQPAVLDAMPLSGVATAVGYGFATAAQFNAFLSTLNGAIAQLNQGLAVLRSHGLIAS